MPKGPAPARKAAHDALHSFCGYAQSDIESSNEHVIKSRQSRRSRTGPPPKADVLLRSAIDGHRLDKRDGRLATGIFYGTLRNLIGIDRALGRFVRAPRGGLDLGVLCVLRAAAYQLMYLERTPSHAVVSDAAELAKALQGKGAAGFVNGVLRSMLRAGTDLGVGSPDVPSVRYSFPDWIAERWIGRYGEDDAARLMSAMNEVPVLTLRVNITKTTVPDFMRMLADAGVEAHEGLYNPEAVRVPKGADVSSLPGYAEGLFAVQDEAAMLVSRLLSVKAGGRYLDACAAPGGKATHIHELASAGALVVAADIGLDKLDIIKENVMRLDCRRAYPVGADSAMPPFTRVFDGALVDAPCTGLGVIRRRPDIRYLRRPGDVSSMSGIQLRLLGSAAGTVISGGALVYSTCSTEPEEGEGVVEAFLDGTDEFRLEDAGKFLPEAAAGLVTDRGYMRTRPDLHDVDGFFGARLVRL